MSQIKIQKYGSVSCGVAPHPNGNLLLVEDVIKILNYILDDESVENDRLRAFRENLGGW